SVPFSTLTLWDRICTDDNNEYSAYCVFQDYPGYGPQNASYSKRCFSSACDSLLALLAAAAAPEACVRPASLTVPFGVASGVFCVGTLAPFVTVPLNAIQGDTVAPVE
uniref:Uncharacterized protein n=1 Tax=Anopheles maculatus TaxID=74869 RepID=A0A182S8R2_9DIPT